MEELIRYLDACSYIVLRIAAAGFLGGVIGYERAHAQRPAGFRTHVLVCVGAALVVMTGEYASRLFDGRPDPMRLGAQVISGIGFLGAGTIMRAGLNVRGLTTAASLWAVACVGLACGIGFYEGAVIASVAIYLTLTYFRRILRDDWERNTFRTIVIHSYETKECLPAIHEVFASAGVEVKNTAFSRDGEHVVITMTVRMPNTDTPDLFYDLRSIKGVCDAWAEEPGTS